MNIKLFFILLLISFVTACGGSKDQKDQNLTAELQEIPLDYAQGFKLFQGPGYKLIEVHQAFPGSDRPFRYLVREEQSSEEPDSSQFDAILPHAADRIVLTSTTQVPHLDLLGISETLVGFPNLDFISTPSLREKIDAGKVIDLGSGASYNLEKIMDLQPGLVIISTLGDNMKEVKLLNQVGIPAVINGDYLEQHPLGRAEWIKFTGALTGRLAEAQESYQRVKDNYDELKTMGQGIPTASKPSILSGNMYKDSWYAPAGNNWGAIFIADAGGKYIFQDKESDGSLQLSYEVVLDQGVEADIWLSTGEYSDLATMGAADPRYRQFEAYKNAQVYTFANTKGPTGGLEYFEMGYSRPDIILKDLLKIFHPELVPNYTPYFYKKIN
ncbi:ABC transporter substrate-binding protein [Echinicola pacifica]|nr:ABC transporter substrate-binding protein [Echinicola pacifica]